ncbi:MAG: TetR/AcrR family transcriptional regulator [Candidatus Wallbacteria bacterium]|nr:TetR/AcrR family transcriptional regulator [Candidatus Wallbacteria bacterium]
MSRPVRKRSIIEDTAIRLFARKGLAGTTIKDIAEQCGVAEGTLYGYYKGKNEMAWALFTREVEKFTTALEAILFDPDKGMHERIYAGVRFTFDYYQMDPERFAFILINQHDFPEKCLLDGWHNPYELISKFILKGIEDKSLPAGIPPEMMVAHLFGLILQPLVMHRYGRIKIELDQAARIVAQACLRLMEVR